MFHVQNMLTISVESPNLVGAAQDKGDKVAARAIASEYFASARRVYERVPLPPLPSLPPYEPDRQTTLLCKERKERAPESDSSRARDQRRERVRGAGANSLHLLVRMRMIIMMMCLLRFSLLWLLKGQICGTEAQGVSAKVLRASNLRRDDTNRLTELFRKEEVMMVTSGGHIHSPRYPHAYPRNVLLSWKLLSPPHTRILVEFDGQFGLEEPENNICRYDFVEVEDIAEKSVIIWGRWCGRKAPRPITSKTNNIKITFKSDDYFVAKPGFKLCYTLLNDATLVPFSNWEAVTVTENLGHLAVTDAPLSADALDEVIAGFSSVEEIFRDLNPHTWQQDLNSISSHTHYYIPRSYHMDRKHKLDLDRLYEDVKQYSCTPRNFSVNLREELKATNTVFFPRCLLVKRCGGNCGCGTDSWNSCTCGPGKTINKIHEVMKFSPGPNFYRRKTRARWVLEEIQLQHHEGCECVCNSKPPR